MSKDQQQHPPSESPQYSPAELEKGKHFLARFERARRQRQAQKQPSESQEKREPTRRDTK